MKLPFRRAVYSSAIVLFFILAPSIVLYTAGYRFDTHQKKLLLTGSLFINTTPEDVAVYVNEALAGNNTPLRLNHLAPNRYTISIEKQGYHTWHKQLEVQPKKTTFAENIILWPTNPEQIRIVEGGVTAMTMNADATRLVWQENNLIKVYNFFNNESTLLITLPNSAPATFNWSLDHQRMTVTQNSNSWFIDTPSLTVKALPTTASDIFFKNGFPDSVYSIEQTQLTQYNTTTQKSATLSTVPLRDALWHSTSWYGITTDNPPRLTQLTLGDAEAGTIFQLPALLEPNLIATAQNHALVFDTPSATLYAFNLDPNEFNNSSQIFQHVTGWQLNEEEKKLLLFNEFEIWSYDFVNQTTNVITRVSNPIQKALWYRDENYIILAFADEVGVIERDNRDHRNYAVLWEGSVQDIVLHPSGEQLYIATSGDSQEILELEIVDLVLFGP